MGNGKSRKKLTRLAHDLRVKRTALLATLLAKLDKREALPSDVPTSVLEQLEAYRQRMKLERQRMKLGGQPKAPKPRTAVGGTWVRRLAAPEPTSASCSDLLWAPLLLLFLALAYL